MSSLWLGKMDMAEERLLVQYRSHLRTEALETAAHVRHSGCDPDPALSSSTCTEPPCYGCSPLCPSPSPATIA